MSPSHETPECFPCGFAVEWVRSCFESEWRLFFNRLDVKTRGRFYFVPEGTPFYPGQHYLESRDWTSDEREGFTLGEVEGARRKYSKGSLGLPHPPIRLLGSEGCLRSGESYPPVVPQRPLARGVDGRCWTDAGLPFPGDFYPDGGAEADGASPIYWGGESPPDPCDVPAWLVTLTGFSGSCASYNLQVLAEPESHCVWSGIAFIEFGESVVVRLEVADFGSGVVLQLYFETTKGFNSTFFYEAPIGTVGLNPGDVSPLSFVSKLVGTCNTSAATIDVEVPVSGTIVEGEGGFEMDGESEVISNVVVGQAGAEGNGGDTMSSILEHGDGGEGDGEATVSYGG